MKNILKITVLFLSIVIVPCSTHTVQAQSGKKDYSKQVNALKQSFEAKSAKSIKPYLSPKFKINPLPANAAENVLSQIFAQFPKLNSLKIIKSEKEKVTLAYDFNAMGKSESNMFFDSNGKITSIEFFENIIKQQMEQQKAQSQAVAAPNLDNIEKKYLPTKVEFTSVDGLIVTGNLYEIGKGKPVILLCHQAGYNRIEYADIAPKLNKMGFNCLAIDQRSGGSFAGKQNNTAERAKTKGINPSMFDAQQDIKAAVAYLNKEYDTKVIVWGSSYSSSLVLLEGMSNDKIKAVIGFSPGDYFGDTVPSLSTVFAKIKIPFLVTSSKQEATALNTLIGNSKLKKNQQQFIPNSDGFHGSRALWTGQKGAEEYWDAVTQFLTKMN